MTGLHWIILGVLALLALSGWAILRVGALADRRWERDLDEWGNPKPATTGGDSPEDYPAALAYQLAIEEAARLKTCRCRICRADLSMFEDDGEPLTPNHT